MKKLKFFDSQFQIDKLYWVLYFNQIGLLIDWFGVTLVSCFILVCGIISFFINWFFYFKGLVLHLFLDSYWSPESLVSLLIVFFYFKGLVYISFLIHIGHWSLESLVSLLIVFYNKGLVLNLFLESLVSWLFFKFFYFIGLDPVFNVHWALDPCIFLNWKVINC